MADFWQHISAFFDPTVSVNKYGDLVEAHGLFDGGNNVDKYGDYDYVDPGNMSATRRFFYDSGDYAYKGYQGFYDLSAANSANSVMDIFSDLTNSTDVLSGLYDLISNDLESYNDSAISSADRAMDFSAEQWEDYKNWIDTQRSTSYQVAMDDMQKAGLNPKLVAKFGGAPVQGGYSPSGVNANLQKLDLSPISHVLNSYITSAASLENKDKDFVQNMLTTFMRILPLIG